MSDGGACRQNSTLGTREVAAPIIITLRIICLPGPRDHKGKACGNPLPTSPVNINQSLRQNPYRYVPIPLEAPPQGWHGQGVVLGQPTPSPTSGDAGCTGRRCEVLTKTRVPKPNMSFSELRTSTSKGPSQRFVMVITQAPTLLCARS